MDIRTGIGQDSHRFDYDDNVKKLILGGVEVPSHHPLAGNSDADVVLHALTNAISGVTGVNVLGEISDLMCKVQGIKDSSAYVREALKHLGGLSVRHVSFSIECVTPRVTPIIPAMRANVAKLLGVPETAVGITATTGEDLTAFGKGEGVQCFCVLTAEGK
jgi:2-C-methyl-D-erythritol 2,4-cyclodiphosphate synthase